MTPKPLKVLQLAGVLLLLLGVVARAGAGEYWGTAVAVLGVVLFTLGRVFAWWKLG